MTAEQALVRHYAEIRARLYGPMRFQARLPMPEPEQEREPGPVKRVSRRVQSDGTGAARKYYWTFGEPIRTCGDRWREILNEVAEKHDVCPREMLGGNKARSVTEARFECWHRMREETAYSFPQIAKRFEKDHSTVVHGVTRWKEIMG